MESEGDEWEELEEEETPGNADEEADPASAEEAALPRAHYAVMLALHGSGVSADSQADAFKWMPPGESEYLFGADKHWVIAPSRHGAHNWEYTGKR